MNVQYEQLSVGVVATVNVNIPYKESVRLNTVKNKISQLNPKCPLQYLGEHYLSCSFIPLPHA